VLRDSAARQNRDRFGTEFGTVPAREAAYRYAHAVPRPGHVAAQTKRPWPGQGLFGSMRPKEARKDLAAFPGSGAARSLERFTF
jgi:hypothetical protein